GLRLTAIQSQTISFRSTSGGSTRATDSGTTVAGGGEGDDGKNGAAGGVKTTGGTLASAAASAAASAGDNSDDSGSAGVAVGVAVGAYRVCRGDQERPVLLVIAKVARPVTAFRKQHFVHVRGILPLQFLV